MKRRLTSLAFFLLAFLLANAAHQPEFSTAGFYELAGTGRSVYNMNPAWRLYKIREDRLGQSVLILTTVRGRLFLCLMALNICPQRQAVV